MTVNDLIRHLSKFDGEMRVVICADDCTPETPTCEKQFLSEGVLYQDECDLEEDADFEQVVAL